MPTNPAPPTQSVSQSSHDLPPRPPPRLAGPPPSCLPTLRPSWPTCPSPLAPGLVTEPARRPLLLPATFPPSLEASGALRSSTAVTWHLTVASLYRAAICKLDPADTATRTLGVSSDHQAATHQGKPSAQGQALAGAAETVAACSLPARGGPTTAAPCPTGAPWPLCHAGG